MRLSNREVRVLEFVQAAERASGQDIIAACRPKMYASITALVIENLVYKQALERVHLGGHKWVYQIGKPKDCTPYHEPGGGGYRGKYARPKYGRRYQHCD